MFLNQFLNRISPSHFAQGVKNGFPTSCVCGKGVLHESKKIRSRHLNSTEIKALQQQGNICQDWSKILVSSDFTPEFIHSNIFMGFCLLGCFDGSTVELGDGSSLPSGLWNCTLQNVEIDSTCVIHRCPRLDNVVVASHSCIINSSVIGGTSACFGNGQWINIGIETGGRSVPIFADLSMELAEYILDNPGNLEIKTDTDAFLSDYSDLIQRPYTIIDTASQILDCRLITSSYIGPYSSVHGAELIENSTLISSIEDPVHIGSAAILRNAILQEGTSVEDGAIIQSSMLFEHSHASQHGKVVDCIVGPNSGVSKGEATASFLGPFVGFHHQSLLIAALWPRGRGNVAYGANVGSNHTSRVPDQEFWPGEGMFFGLSCTIKYPANFREAAYTIVAAGVTTLPQRMSYPFSLINEPVGYYLEVPPGFQNLIPAWGLTENYYALKRNEGKYIARNKAKRNIFDLNLFRPEILRSMENAIKALQTIKVQKPIYLPGDLPGIGKNMLTDENRLKAIAAYHFFLDLARYRAEMRQLNPATLPENRDIVIQNLEKLASMLPSLITRTESSRARDFERGSSIIDDYHLTHVTVDKDPFVLQVKAEIEQEILTVRQMIARLRQSY